MVQADRVLLRQCGNVVDADLLQHLPEPNANTFDTRQIRASNNGRKKLRRHLHRCRQSFPLFKSAGSREQLSGGGDRFYLQRPADRYRHALELGDWSTGPACVRGVVDLYGCMYAHLDLELD